MVEIRYRDKAQELKDLQDELRRLINFYNSGNSINQDWTKAEVILLLDHIEYHKNPVGVFHDSATVVNQIIESGRVKNFEITKDGEVIEYEPEEVDEEIEEVACTSIWDENRQTPLEETQGYQYMLGIKENI